jgi:xylulokinase
MCEAQEYASGSDASVAAVGVSGMVPTLVCLDRQGTVLRHSIQQNDARTSAEIEYMRDVLEPDEVFEACGSAISQQHIGPKVLWLKQHEPEVYDRIHTIMGSYDYITYRLTQELNVEENWALEAGFFDVAERHWLQEVLEAADIAPEWLPPVRNCTEVVGGITAEVAEHTGVAEGTPVVAGAADHVASTFAAGVRSPGDVNVKIGGAGDILFCLDELSIDPRMFIDYHLIEGKYLLNGCMASSGSLVKWFRDELCPRGTTYSELDAAAAEVPPGADGLLVLPYFVGEKTPIFDPLARGVFMGLTLHHTRAHMHRAILEAVAFGFRHHLDVARELGYEAERAVITDGGARSSLWRQITADVLGVPVTQLRDHSGSALGVAFAAGMGTGMFDSWEDITRFLTPAGTTHPRAQNTARYDEYYREYRQLYQVLKPRFRRLNELQ